MVSRSGFGIWCHDPGFYLFYNFVCLSRVATHHSAPVSLQYLLMSRPGMFLVSLIFYSFLLCLCCTLFSFCYFGFCLFYLFLVFLVPLVVWFCFYLAFVNKARLLFPYFLPPMCVCFSVLIKLPTP